MPPEKVLIAHQATIPSYRVAFFEALERLRPPEWEFTAVYDERAARRQRFLPIDRQTLGFPTLEVRERRFGPGRGLLYQPFLRAARGYDLVIVGDELHNLSYTLAHLVCRRVARWGHGRNVGIDRPRPLQRLTEGFRFALARRASAYFAYTASVRDFLIDRGVAPERIVTIDNTIDIEAERRRHDRLVASDTQPRRSRPGERRLLHVGRLRARKRIGFLVEAVDALMRRRPGYVLTVVGAGDPGPLRELEAEWGPSAVRLLGPLPAASKRLDRLMLDSDLYIYPGPIGLGGLSALCFDLTPAVIDAPTQNPEFDYLTPENALICPPGTSAAEYARAIDVFLSDGARLERCREAAWPSIRHLTIERMAKRFAEGIDRLLERRSAALPRRSGARPRPTPGGREALPYPRTANVATFRGPLFVVGMPRSGTKLVRAILNRHSRIALSVAESQIIPFFVRRYGRAPRFDRDGLRRLARRLERTVFLDTARRQGRKFDVERFVAAVDPASWTTIFEHVLRAAAPDRDPATTIWGDKTPGYLNHIRLLAEIFPGARFLHVVRDPRDCALSVKKSFRKSPLRAADRWAQSVARAELDGRALGDAAYRVVRYEELLAEPRATLRAVCDFLEIPFEEEITAIGESPEDLGDTVGRHGIVVDNVGKHARELSPDEARRIEEIVCEVARPLGYDIRPEVVRRPLAPGARALLKIGDGWATLRHHARYAESAAGTLSRAVRHYHTSSWR